MRAPATQRNAYHLSPRPGQAAVQPCPRAARANKDTMSIRTRLLLLALLATLLPALLVLARFLHERGRAIEADTATLAVVAQRRAEAVAERIRGTAQLHYGLARANDLLTDDRAACSAFLSQVREAYPQYTGILTIRPDGRLFCDSLRSGRELDLRDRAYFKAALLARDKVVLEPVFGRLTGVAVLQIAYPVRSAQGELQFVLLASLNLQKLFDVGVLSVPGARLMVLDDKGTLLAASRGDASGPMPGGSLADSALHRFASAHAGASTGEIAETGAEPHVWAVADTAITEQAGLHVLAGAPRSALLTAANRRFGQDMALLGGAALLLFGAVWLFAEISLRKQIARTTRMAEQLAGGDLSARIEPPLPRGELGALMGSLNQAAQSLAQQRSDIEQLNSRLQQSQRLEAIGQLTGGVAHDFNNLLTVVMGNAELLAEQAADGSEQLMLAEMIGSAAERGAALTRHLLAFARKQALMPAAIDANQLVSGLDAMLRRTLGEHIEIELIRGAGLWQALVDPSQLENALLNLCLNARDAMPQGGRLTVETANARLDQDYADRQADVTPGQYVMLAVSDTGNGIAPDHLAQVFQPFFTTKEKGKGTGLGLAMVYGFVKQSAGHIAIYSELGHGTTVKLYLPRTMEAAATAPDPGAAWAAAGGEETVLVVEDDPMVRRYACNQLRSLGYRVVDVDNGLAAMQLVEQRDDLDLLFTDVVMPGALNGRALADAARQRRPGLRVLYTSGYTENAIVHHGRLDPGVQLLAKPYRRVDLARAVRLALARVAVETG
jgi:signal transduction histidine kinase/ActR/RegA family two-component response regulator